MIFVGDDWAEAHHDVYVCDEAGVKLASKRLPEGIDGMAKLHDLVASHAADPGDVVVGIETDRGLWVHALVEAGYVVYAINPKAASRYRDRHTLSGAKSDPGGQRRCSPSWCAPIATIIARSPATLLFRRGSRSSPVLIRAWCGNAPGRRIGCAVRYTSTSLPRSTRSLSWPIATRSRCWERRRHRARQPNSRRARSAPCCAEPVGSATSSFAPMRLLSGCAATLCRAPAAVESAHGATTQAARGDPCCAQHSDRRVGQRVGRPF